MQKIYSSAIFCPCVSKERGTNINWCSHGIFRMLLSLLCIQGYFNSKKSPQLHGRSGTFTAKDSASNRNH